MKWTAQRIGEEVMDRAVKLAADEGDTLHPQKVGIVADPSRLNGVNWDLTGFVSAENAPWIKAAARQLAAEGMELLD